MTEMDFYDLREKKHVDGPKLSTEFSTANTDGGLIEIWEETEAGLSEENMSCQKKQELLMHIIGVCCAGTSYQQFPAISGWHDSRGKPHSPFSAISNRHTDSSFFHQLYAAKHEK